MSTQLYYFRKDQTHHGGGVLIIVWDQLKILCRGQINFVMNLYFLKFLDLMAPPCLEYFIGLHRLMLKVYTS